MQFTLQPGWISSTKEAYQPWRNQNKKRHCSPLSLEESSGTNEITVETSLQKKKKKKNPADGEDKEGKEGER